MATFTTKNGLRNESIGGGGNPSGFPLSLPGNVVSSFFRKRKRLVLEKIKTIRI